MPISGSFSHNPLDFFELLKGYIGANPSIGPQMTAQALGGMQGTFADLLAWLNGFQNAQYQSDIGDTRDMYSVNPLQASDVNASLYNLPGLDPLVQRVDPNAYGRQDFDIDGAISSLLGQRGSAPRFSADSIGSMGAQLDAAVPQRQSLDLGGLFTQAKTNLRPEMTRWGDRPLPEFDYGSIMPYERG